MSFSEPRSEIAGLAAWRERARVRSLDQWRARSDEQVSRLVSATRALILEAGGTEFTVQQVVQRAGLSLKTCYRHFGGKDELLLAAFEEQARDGAELLGRLAGRERTPLGRLRACVIGLCATARGPSAPEAAAAAREHLRLAEQRPQELRAALEPLVGLLTRMVAEAADVGAVRPGTARRDAKAIFDLCTAHVHAVVLGAGGDEGEAAATPEYVWEFCRAALAPRGALRPVTEQRRRRGEGGPR